MERTFRTVRAKISRVLLVGWSRLDLFVQFYIKNLKNLKTRVCFLRVRKMPLWNGIETNVSGDNNARNKPEVRGIWNEIIFAPIPFECDGALSVTESSILSLQSWRYFTGNSNYIVYSQVIESKNDPRFTQYSIAQLHWSRWNSCRTQLITWRPNSSCICTCRSAESTILQSESPVRVWYIVITNSDKTETYANNQPTRQSKNTVYDI